MRFLFTNMLILCACLLSCRRNDVPKQIDQKWDRTYSVDFNQELSIRENLKIETFLAHYTSVKMTQTSSGLRYYIYQKEESKLPNAKEGQEALVRLTIGLLDGTICYQTEDGQIERIVIEHSQKESGIHEALQYLKKGEKAKLILPSYLGHGLLGDRLKIPPQSILFVDIQLIDLI